MSGISVDDVKLELQKFGWPDYTVFVIMLMVCAVIGVYFGFFDKKPKAGGDEKNYLVGGRQMAVIPITLSLIAR